MIEKNSDSLYSKNWNRFYSHLTESDATSLWDVAPEQSIVIDYELFKEHFNADLPVIDFGCGTGIQSNFLSQHFPKVLGLDSSDLVIEKNKTNKAFKNVTFDVYDGIDHRAAQQLHDKLGDSNIYIRGVLHQVKEDDRPGIVKAISQMMGQKGTLYIVEILPELQKYLRSQVPNFSALPLQMKSVFMGDLPPTGLDPGKITKLFSKEEFRIIQQGEASISTLLKFNSGRSIQIPSAYYIIKKQAL